MFKSLAFAGIAAATATDFYVAHDLTQAQVAQFTEQGCNRGQYGQDSSLTLLTCPPTAGAEADFSAPEDTFMCVVELAKEQQGISSATQAFFDETDTTTLYAQGREIIVMGPGDQTVRPHACCPSHYNGAVDNTLYVPKAAMVPLRPMNPSNAGVRRASMIRAGGRVGTNPIIVEALADFSKENCEANTKSLATGPTGDNTQITRNSYAIQNGRGGCQAGWDCANHAVDDIQAVLEQYFENYSGVWKVEQQTFRADMCNNIVLTVEGTVNRASYIVSGSHADSRNTNSGSTASGVAPGADDNASGSAVHLEMARVIAQNQLRFENSIKMMWFCGEEQGLLGSAALADEAVRNGDEIIGMFNSDMIGYTDPADNNGEPIVSYMGRNSSPELSQMCKDFSQLYLPDLEVGDSGVCCSDQQSFHSRGFQAAGIFETRANFVRYPRYHQVGDTWDNGFINYEQIYQFGMSIFAGMLEFAVPVPVSQL